MPFGDATMIKCARCVQAARLEEATREQARAAEEASRRQAWAAEEAAGHQRQAALALASAQAAAEAQAQAAQRRASAAEAALEQDRALRAASAEAAAARAAKCPWCRSSETHAAFEECIDADEALSEVGDMLTDDDAWDDERWADVAGDLERLSAALGDTTTLHGGTYPYCSKKCRHDARSAGDDDATAVPRLEARRLALHGRVSAAWKRGSALHARAVAQARAASEALGILTDARKGEAEHRARVAAVGVALAGAKEQQEEAATGLAAAKFDLSQAATALEQAQAAARSFFGRLGGAEGRAALAEVELESARARVAGQMAVVLRAQRGVESAGAALRALSDGPKAASVEGSHGARAHILSVLGLSRAPKEVQEVVVGCLVGAVCPPGTFEMGSPTSEQGRDSDETLHRVTLTRAFAIGAYPVVQALWEAVMGDNPSKFVGLTRPVENVSWEDCVAFCEALNGRLGLPAATRTAASFRLPTEAEWEYAARAGQRFVYAGGNDPSAVGWCSENSGERTNPVGQKRANAWGLHDMTGNVWECTADWYGAYPSGSVTDPTGPSSGSGRVIRGGSWNLPAQYARVAFRGRDAPANRCDYLGFRLARTSP